MYVLPQTSSPPSHHSERVQFAKTWRPSVSIVPIGNIADKNVGRDRRLYRPTPFISAPSHTSILHVNALISGQLRLRIVPASARNACCLSHALTSRTLLVVASISPNMLILPEHQAYLSSRTAPLSLEERVARGIHIHNIARCVRSQCAQTSLIVDARQPTNNP